MQTVQLYCLHFWIIAYFLYKASQFPNQNENYVMSRSLFSLKFILSTFFFSFLTKWINGICDRKSFLLQECAFHILGDDLKSQIRHHMIWHGSDYFGTYTDILPCHELLFLFPWQKLFDTSLVLSFLYLSQAPLPLEDWPDWSEAEKTIKMKYGFNLTFPKIYLG